MAKATIIQDLPEQVQHIKGSSGEDVFRIDASASGYGWGLSADQQGIVVWNDRSYDVLHGVETVEFTDLILHFDGSSITQETIIDTDAKPHVFEDVVKENEFLRGGQSSEDAFVINGKASDYLWTLAEDGAGVVVWRGNEFAVLHDIEQIRFADATVHFDGKDFTLELKDTTPVEPQVYQDTVGENDFITGSLSNEDVFVINGHSSDYGWSLAQDGQGVVVWNGDEYAVLHDVEQIRFSDKTIEHKGKGIFEDVPSDNPITAQSDTVTASAGASVIIPVDTLLANDSDANGSALSIQNPQIDPAQGTVSLDSNDNLVYTPATGFSGQAFIEYVVINEQGYIASSSLTLKLDNSAGGLPTELNVANLEALGLGETLSDEKNGDYENGAFALLGDINGDGFDDLGLGVSQMDPGGKEDAGGAYIVYGGPDVSLGSIDLDNLNGDNGFTIHGSNPGDGFGDVVKGIGDLNGDGLDDILVTAFDAETSLIQGRTAAGRDYIVYGNQDGFGENFDIAELNGENGFILERRNPNSTASINGIGDVNSDGFDDLGFSSFGVSESTHVLFGQQGPFDPVESASTLEPHQLTQISHNTSSIPSGVISGIGDINGDGIDDILSSMRFKDTLPTYPYSTYNYDDSYVIFGSEYLAQVIETENIDGTNGFALLPRSSPGSETFWRYVTSAGDINGDGISDMAITKDKDTYIVFGSDQVFDPQLDLYNLNGDNGFKLQNIHGELKNAGDLNNDGFDDLAIVNQFSSSGGLQSNGAVSVLYGKNQFDAVVEVNDLYPDHLNTLNGEESGDRLGANISSTSGDLNGDGVDELLIGMNPGEGRTSELYQVFQHSDHQNDGITGTSANDILAGSLNNDVLTGLAGPDRFIASEGNDTITDLLFAEGDVLDLDALLSNQVTDTNVNDHVSLSQSGANGVVTVTEGGQTSTITLNDVDLTPYHSATELLDAGYLDY